ncbi:uncharacterized protein V6R79_022364 [Siganus canaliculatus]
MADREEDEELGQDKDINTSVDLIEDQQVPGQAEEESECPGCQSLGVLTLPCGHKLCPTCIELSQGEMAQTGCTICYGSQLLDSVLHSLLEALFHGQPRRPRDPTAALEGKEAEDGGMEKEEEALCLEHGEMLSVFCEEERELMCQQCQVQEHEEHQCCPTQEAVLKCKKELRSAIRSLQEQLETLTSVRRAWEDTAVYIKNYKKAFERVNCRAEEPEDESEILLDVAEHQSCVQHQAWDKMLKIIQYFPVTMDPNTGSVCLGVSPDLSSVFVCEEQPLPDNPERFVSPQSILGSEGFSSGRHNWEVEVGDNSHWSLGVASESVHRKDWANSDLNPGPSLDSDTDSDSGLWTVSLSSGEFWASPGHSAPLRLRRRPSRVRIQLDWERGCLTFSDANDNTLIYRFKRQWKGTLRPYFSTTCSKHPLKITAGRVTVNIE